jgi:hypothetical protein
MYRILAEAERPDNARRPWPNASVPSAVNKGYVMKLCPRLTSSAALIALFSVCGGLGVTGGLSPASAQQPATVSQTVETMATIETVDRQTRHVLLRKDDGTLLTVTVGPEVRNFAQLKPGDRIHARYEVAVAARVSKPGQPAMTDRDVQTVTRAAPGAKPFAQRDIESHRRVRITGIDLDHNTVTFVGNNNIQNVIFVRTPEMQAFLRTLKVGDEVDVVFREAAMVSVESAR